MHEAPTCRDTAYIGHAASCTGMVVYCGVVATLYVNGLPRDTEYFGLTGSHEVIDYAPTVTEGIRGVIVVALT